MWIGTYGRGLMRFDSGPARHAVGAGVAPAQQRAGRLRRRRRQRLGRHAGRPAASAAGRREHDHDDRRRPAEHQHDLQDPRGPLLVTALNGRLFQVSRQTLVPVRSAGVARRARRSQCLSRQPRSALGRDRRSGHRAHRRHARSSRFTMKQGLVNDFVRAFCEDREGGIWIGTDGGLSYWRDGDVQQLHGQRPASSTAASAACCWIATTALGGHGARPERSSVRRVRPRSRGSNRCAARRCGRCIRTPTAALDRHAGRRPVPAASRDGLTQFTTEHGLPSNKIHFIGEDRHGNLWMSGPSGVVSVSRRDLESSSQDPSRQVAVRALRHDRRAEHESDERRRAAGRRGDGDRRDLAARARKVPSTSSPTRRSAAAACRW